MPSPLPPVIYFVHATEHGPRGACSPLLAAERSQPAEITRGFVCGRSIHRARPGPGIVATFDTCIPPIGHQTHGRGQETNWANVGLDTGAFSPTWIELRRDSMHGRAQTGSGRKTKKKEKQQQQQQQQQQHPETRILIHPCTRPSRACQELRRDRASGEACCVFFRETGRPLSVQQTCRTPRLLTGPDAVSKTLDPSG
ncbi:hypothetical protein CDD83_10904 [Cordyceps sp. RAO-2017]|nr:hypothetical protein CDD83_10904 [Cordyceps sp. RAO-2017]